MSPADKSLPDNTGEELETTVLFLVRHAEKADDGTADPDLTAEGIMRAEKLSDILGHEDIRHIFSTDYKRTKQTAQPLSEMLNLEVKSYDPRDFNELLTFISENIGSNMLIVGHSNSTPSLSNAILGEEKYEQIDESDYGNMFKITLKGDQSTSELIRF